MRYIHPTLWIEVNTNYVNWTPSVDYTKVYNHEVSIGVKYDMLKDMWFEPVEETPEWIKKAAEDLNKTWAWRVYKWDWLEQLAKAILDNMPKQEKITIDDIDDFKRSHSQSQTFAYTPRWFAIKLLKDKWLLQE